MATGAGDGKMAGEMSEGGVRALKFAIVAMGVMIVVGLLAVIGRIVYLAGKNPRPPAASTVAAGVSGAPLSAQISADLPQGATVRSLSLAGDRLAVHYEAPNGGGILVIDLVAGQVASRIGLVPSPPRSN
jgi:hypothetical protein